MESPPKTPVLSGILDLAPEVRIIIWKNLSTGDQKTLRQTCSTFLSDIDYLIGVNGVMDGTSNNVDWIVQVRLKSLNVVGKHFPKTLVRQHALVCFHGLGRLLHTCHPNLTTLQLTTDTFNMEGFQGRRLQNLEVSTSRLRGPDLKAFEKFLAEQYHLQRLVCDLSTVNWAFYIPVLRNCSESMIRLELSRIPTMTGVSIDILDWSKFPVLPQLKTFKLGSATRDVLPFPLQCLHSINFPIFHVADITELELVNVKLRELDVILILAETQGRLKTVNLRYYLTRVTNLYSRLEHSLREGKLEALTLCDTMPVTSDQLASNENLRHTCRQYDYTFTWNYPYGRKGYGYRLQLERNYSI